MIIRDGRNTGQGVAKCDAGDHPVGVATGDGQGHPIARSLNLEAGKLARKRRHIDLVEEIIDPSATVGRFGARTR